ncbi:MAG: SLBB domain-containing protein [Chitinophagia bacterium]
MKKMIRMNIAGFKKCIFSFWVIAGIFLLSTTNLMAQSKGENSENQKAVSDTQILKNQQQRKESSLSEEKKKAELTPEEKKKAEIEKLLFGYNIFHNNVVSFEPNLNMATPKDYVVGPKDELELQVYGIAQNKYEVTVSKEGRISLPDIGIVQVAGFTIEALQSLLTQKMSIRYAGMRGPSPNTFLQVSLTNIRTIKVNMVGEIAVPGTYSLPSYVNVFNALFAAGGPTIKGTFRAVQVFRNNKPVAEIDLYEFILNGKISQNIRLEDNDVILIKTSTNKVTLRGEVRTPGIFEMKNGENLQDLLKFGGGFSESAYKQMVGLLRKGILENEYYDIVSANFSKISLIDGDIVGVNPIQDKISNRVIISGSVLRPGQYEWSKGIRVKDLVQKAGGFKGDAFLKNILVYRTKYDLTQEIITIDLSKNDFSDTTNNILLNKDDAVSIKSIIDLREEFYVQINGEINNAGTYPLLDKMSLYDLVLMAGGGKYSASGSYIEIARRNLNDPNKISEIISIKDNKSMLSADTLKKIILYPFDNIFIRNTPGYYASYSVEVKGEVILPGQYVVDKKEMRISDLIIRAGGITKFAYLDGATLLRRTKNFNTLSVTEQENERLNSVKQNVSKDNLLATTETNKYLNQRIDSKINQNSSSINFERKQKEDDITKQSLIKDNVQLKGKEENTETEKRQELVAINLASILKEPGSSNDLVLKEGDILEIPELLETVSIRGGVLYPVSVKYESNLNFKDYVMRSGGYVPKADRSRAIVIQANGKVEVQKRFLFFKRYPKILPGAQIIVPVDPVVKAPFSYEKGLSLITSTLTLIFLLRNL